MRQGAETSNIGACRIISHACTVYLEVISEPPVHSPPQLEGVLGREPLGGSPIGWLMMLQRWCVISSMKMAYNVQNNEYVMIDTNTGT